MEIDREIAYALFLVVAIGLVIGITPIGMAAGEDQSNNTIIIA